MYSTHLISLLVLQDRSSRLELPVGGTEVKSCDVTRTVWCSTHTPLQTHTYTGFLTQSKLFFAQLRDTRAAFHSAVHQEETGSCFSCTSVNPLTDSLDASIEAGVFPGRATRTRRNHREAPSLLVHHPVSWRTAAGVSCAEGPRC